MKDIAMKFAVALAATLVAASAAQASLVNPSFESGDLAGWTPVNSGGYASGVSVTYNVDDQANQYPKFDPTLPGTADGDYYANVRGHGPEGGGAASSSYLYQDVGALEALTEYTLIVAVGVSRFDQNPPEVVVSLVGGTDQTGTVLGSALASTLGMASYEHDFRDLTVTFATGASVSGDLTIVIESIGGFSSFSSSRIDNVRLTTQAVPEPASLALVAAGLALVGLRRH